MNKLSIASVLALVAAFVAAPWLAACKDKQSSPDCASALEHAMQVSRAELAAMDDATVARIKQASLTRCLEDHWSAEALACVGKARTGGDLGACEGTKTADQRDKLAKAVAAATGTGSDGGTTGSGAGSATAAGSGDGSAASGGRPARP
jgi:hypothetical protein